VFVLRVALFLAVVVIIAFLLYAGFVAIVQTVS
jgi:hypothetical protein